MILAGGLSQGADIQECPADKPHKRTASSPVMMCTLKACLPRLHCPTNGGECQYIASNDCNTCASDKYQICLSDDELKAAQGVGGFLSVPQP
jgi:hypothetical protein